MLVAQRGHPAYMRVDAVDIGAAVEVYGVECGCCPRDVDADGRASNIRRASRAGVSTDLRAVME